MFHNPALLLLFFIKRAKPSILRTLLSVTSWEKDYTATESYDKNGVRTKRVEKYKDRTRTWVYQNGKRLKYINKTSKGVKTQLFDPKSGKRIRTDYQNGEIGTFTYLKNGRILEKKGKPGIFSNTNTSSTIEMNIVSANVTQTGI